MNAAVEILYTISVFVGVYFMFLFVMLFASGKNTMRTMPNMKKFPLLSIVVPAYNEEGVIENTISILKKLKYPRVFEIIVVDDGSSDKTYDIVSKIKGIRFFTKKNGGKASALNFGIKKAKGEIIAVVDSDSMPEKFSLMKSVPFFSEKDVAAVTTSVFVNNPKNIMQHLQKIEYVMIAWSRKLLEFLNSIYATPGPLSLYKKSVLKKVGGFDEKNLTEDIEIAWRLMSKGFKIRMALDAEVYTNPPSTFRKWWHQRARWNIGGMQTYVKYLDMFFNKKFNNIGMFLLPMFSISYVLSFIGVLTFIFYIIPEIIFNAIFFFIGSYSIGTNPMNYFNAPFLPNILMILGAVVVILTLAYVKINLGTMRKPLGEGWLLSMAVYLIFYMAIFPFNLIYSSLRFIRKDFRW